MTDYGIQDPYVGILKSRVGVVNPKALLVDLSHSLRQYDVSFASWFLYLSYVSLESPSFVCAVVDPGVGTERKPIIVRIQKRYFVLPDNGLITLIYEENKEKSEVFEIEPKKLEKLYKNFLQKKKIQLQYELSTTFHGRDLFAPAVGFLSYDVKLRKKFTKSCESIYTLKDIIHPIKIDLSQKGNYKGKFVYYDHFGNLFTNFKIINKKTQNQIQLKIFEQKKEIMHLENLFSTYGEKEKDSFLFYVGSFGFLEVAMNQNSAFSKWGNWDQIKNFDLELRVL